MVRMNLDKKLLLCLLIAILFGVSLKANNLDSLRQVAYSDASYSDRVNALGALVSFFRHHAFDSAYFYAQEQVLLAEEWGDTRFTGIAYQDLGKTLLMSSHYQEAISPYQKAFDLLAEANDLGNQADVSLDLGFIHSFSIGGILSSR